MYLQPDADTRGIGALNEADLDHRGVRTARRDWKGLVVSWLLERGMAVRAMVRVRDERAERLAEAGAEVAVADYDDLGSLSRRR